MHATTVPDPKFNPPEIGIITPEQMVKEEAAIIPLVGDRAAAGRYLTHVGENELEEPVRLTGGARYMDANYNPVTPDESAAWESGAGRISALSKQAGRAGEGGRPVYGMYVAGSGTNTDFNVMGANALLQQIPFSKITKKSEKAFDQAMREGTKAFKPIPEWPGIRSPLAQEMILDKSNGILRTKLFDTMGKEEFQSMGFPEVPGTRKSIIEPELLDVPTNQAGFRMARMDTSGRIIEDPIIPSDYPTAWAGKVAGKLDQPADYKDIWQTHHEARRLMGDKAPESGDYYSFSRAHPIQYADQEWLDKLMQQRFANERKIKTGEYKEGGEVDMTESDKKLHALIDGHRFKHAMKSGGKVESKIEGDHPDAKLHALIESRRKEVRMAAGGQAFKAAMKSSATEAKPIGFDKGGAAFGVFPHLNRNRSKQDPEAAKNIPVAQARGMVAGLLGLPADTINMIGAIRNAGRSDKPFSEIPYGSEHFLETLPFKDESPVGKAAGVIGSFTPPVGTALEGARVAGKGAKQFAKALAETAGEKIAMGQPLVPGVPASITNPMVKHIMKPEDGNWIKGSVEQDLKSLKRTTPSGNDVSEILRQMKERYTPQVLKGMQEGSRQNIVNQMADLEKMEALNKWVDSNLKNYVKKQMGTIEDPVRKLAEEGIVHIPTNEVGRNRWMAPSQRSIFKGEQVGQSDAAKAWEDATDVVIKPVELKDLPKEYHEPWMENAPKDTIISHLNREFDTQALGFDHIMDVLRQDLVSGRIRPEQLNKVSMEQAVRRTSEYDQDMAKQMRETALQRQEGFPVHKEYPEGYKWLELSLPPDKVLPEGHSIVRNKGVSLDSDDAYLLKDATGKVIGFGESEADIVRNLSNTNNSEGYKKLKDALDYEGKAMGHCVGSYCDEVSGGNTKIYTLRDAKGEPHVTIEVEPGHGEQSMEAAEERFKKARATDPKNTPKNFIDWAEDNDVAFDADTFRNPSIIQIKGKQNRAPKEEYLPYVQDFVKSGQWTGIGDLKNSGLKTIDEAFPSYEDAKYFANTNPNAKYVSQADIDAHRKQVNEELINEFGSHRIKPDPQSKTTYGRTDFMTAKELAELEFPGDLERQANMIRGAMQGTTEPGAYSGTIYPPLAERNGGAIGMAPGGLIKNLLKMTAKEEALSKIPQMKKEAAMKEALEAEYRKAMREVPYDQQITLKNWEASQKKPATKTVWHGSPHHFPPAKNNPLGAFDATKIGTGEGTQAYGHGHYLAEAKGNAEGYRHMLSVDPSQGSENIKYATLEKFMPNEAPAVQREIKGFLDGTGNYNDFVRVMKQHGSDDFKKALVSEEPEMFKAGALYQVELPEEKLASMLDYDLPWTQQPEAVKKAINVGGLQKFYNSEELPMSQIFHHAHQSMTPPQFAEFLRSKGIPGIKYKDAQSRGIREAEEGTRNIVIFPGNEDLLNIVGKEKRGGLIHTRKQYA
jgi:hypothetical protein